MVTFSGKTPLFCFSWNTALNRTCGNNATSVLLILTSAIVNPNQTTTHITLPASESVTA